MGSIEEIPDKTKRKRIHLNRNRKKAWKKHIDISEVEEHLENERLRKIAGDLLDKDQLLNIEDEKPEEVEKKEAPNKKKIKLDLSNLKCFRNLKSKSKIQTPSQPARPRAPRLTKLQQWMQQREEAKKLKKSLVRVLPKKKKSEDEEFLWDDSGEDPEAQKTLEPWEEHALRVRRVLRPKPPPRFYQPPSLLRGQELPTHGQSAHPDPKEHQALLLKAHQEEVARVIEETKWRQKLYVPPDQRVDRGTKLQETLQGLPGVNESEEEEEQEKEEGEEEAPLLIKRPIRPEDRKTKKQRRTKKLQKEKERAARARKMEKKNLGKVALIKTMAKELRAREKESVSKALQRVKKKAVDKMFKTHQLGPIKYEERPLATQVPLTEELPAGGSLRLLKPISGQGTNIYHGFLRRNMIEPRKKQKMARRKLKDRLYEKK